MLYPIVTYSDSKKITAFKMNGDRTVSLYIVKFNKELDSFIHAEILLQYGKVISSEGYSSNERKVFVEQYDKIKNDIINYVKENGANGGIGYGKRNE